MNKNIFITLFFLSGSVWIVCTQVITRLWDLFVNIWCLIAHRTDTIDHCQRPVFSLGVSQHMHKTANLWKFQLNRLSKLRDINERKKTPWSHKVVCFQMLDFETSNSKLEVLKSNSWKITSFSKTTSLQGELFLTIFYTTNLALLLVIKKGFMIIIILSDYQLCQLPLILLSLCGSVKFCVLV